MISGISSGIDYNSIISSNSSSQSSSLSYDQQQVLDDTLSNYDSSDLSQSDALEIVAAFQEANIEPSKQLENALSSLGFDAQEIGELAGVSVSIKGAQGAGGPPPPPPPSSSSEDEDEDDDEEEFDTVSSLLETLFSEEDEDETNSFDTVSDYTSRILNLNEDAKEDIMSTFEKYNDENSTLSTADKATLAKSYLSDILNDSSNYNHSSFYA